jgi:hypothetical protein
MDSAAASALVLGEEQGNRLPPFTPGEVDGKDAGIPNLRNPALALPRLGEDTGLAYCRSARYCSRR